MEYFFSCPYCWQEISMVLDPAVKSQTYVEDCEVCCQPWSVMVQYRENGTADVSVEPLDE